MKVLELMEELGDSLRWRCSDAQLVCEAMAPDRIAFNLEMSPLGWLSVDGHKIETAVAQIYCGSSSYGEAQANEKVTGKLQLIDNRVLARIILPQEKFRALQSMMASGAKPVDLEIKVRGLKSEGYGTGVWDRDAAERGSLIADCSLICRAQDAPGLDRSESDARMSEILDAIQKIEHRTAKWTNVLPWVIGPLLLIAATILIKKW
jgi:hypothetical protein